MRTWPIPTRRAGCPSRRSFPGEGQLAPPRAGTFIGGIASGTDSLPLPEGFGIPLKKGTRVTFDVHYHKEPGEGTGVWDRSEIGFILTDTPPSRVMGGNIDRAARSASTRSRSRPARRHYQLGPVTATFTKDSEIINLMPHMHMRGAAAKFEAIYPDGTPRGAARGARVRLLLADRLSLQGAQVRAGRNQDRVHRVVRQHARAR